MVLLEFRHACKLFRRPIAFTKLQCAADEFLARFPCNHIHAVYGDHVEEFRIIAQILGIEVGVFGDKVSH